MKPETAVDTIYGWLQGKQGYTQEALEELVKRIQLEHWKQGMTDASAISNDTKLEAHEIPLAIERARDERKAI